MSTEQQPQQQPPKPTPTVEPDCTDSPAPPYEEQQPFLPISDRDLEMQQQSLIDMAGTAAAEGTQEDAAKKEPYPILSFFVGVLGLAFVITGLLIFLRVFVWFWKKLGLI